jgi:hypothetical protein
MEYSNCVGAIDGKHVRIRCAQNSGSQFYNYKSYFSVHLQTVVDAEYKFMTVDIEAYGRQSDSGVFTEFSVFRHLEAGPFNLPPPRQILRTNITLPFVLVGDQGYALKEYLMRPYPTDNDRVSRQKEIFSYRLSRPRRTVECAFGILVARWRCLKTELQVNPEHVDTIITVYLLHNIIIDKEGVNETGAMTQITPEDDSNVRSSNRYNRAKQMHVVYETGSCNILMLKEQLIFSNKNRAYIIQTK